uniref:Protein-cysteine N-palmitoyltransferase Rasp n=1 Tax=Clastoptera arizonana TaxID=38151 RepID=A0A1B6DAC9_9HEMI
MVVSNGWMHLRCSSFCFDFIKNSKQKANWKDLITMLGYCFYLPVFFIGPIILYEDFSKAMMLPFEKWSWKRVLDLFINLSRFLFWLVVTDFSLYFFYAHALQYHIQEVERLGLWTLNGLGYFLGQFFCNKYIVLYGLAGTIAKAERYYAPPTPKCIARIHLYSETWRTFDVGYYSFLLKYMYIPLCGEKRNMTRKLSASFLCFCFVFIWHGMEISVFIWSLLNFIGITLEAVGRSVANSELYKSLQKKTLSPTNIRRFNALITSPLFAMSAISNFYFFGGTNVGNSFFKQFYQGPWYFSLVLWLFLYCMCNVSIEIKEWELERKEKSKLL